MSAGLNDLPAFPADHHFRTRPQEFLEFFLRQIELLANCYDSLRRQQTVFAADLTRCASLRGRKHVFYSTRKRQETTPALGLRLVAIGL